jgi:hypothetical protein
MTLDRYVRWGKPVKPQLQIPVKDFKMNAQLTEAQELIQGLLGHDEAIVQLWWNSPNKAFQGNTPLSEWNQSPESVLSYLRVCINGAW